MEISTKQRLGNFWWGFKAWAEYKKTVEVVGVQDICQDGLRVLFLEYDGKLQRGFLLKELKRIQEDFKLSSIYVLESSKDNFHAYCTDKMTSKEINEIVDTTSSDYMFRKNHAYDYVSRVLRISCKGRKPKPKYIGTVFSDYHRREKSFAHLMLLKHHFKIRLDKADYKNSDKKKLKSEEALEIIKYITAHGVT
jgi:uncharacterized protein YeeX (DUF496 family)